MTNSTIDPAQTTSRQAALRVDESRITTGYANTIRTSTTVDEVILDFGMSLPRASGNGPAIPVFTVDSRIVVNWANAKRLALALAQTVQAYEQQNGEISLAQRRSGTPSR